MADKLPNISTILVSLWATVAEISGDRTSDAIGIVQQHSLKFIQVFDALLISRKRLFSVGGFLAEEISAELQAKDFRQLRGGWLVP